MIRCDVNIYFCCILFTWSCFFHMMVFLVIKLEKYDRSRSSKYLFAVDIYIVRNWILFFSVLCTMSHWSMPNAKIWSGIRLQENNMIFDECEQTSDCSLFSFNKFDYWHIFHGLWKKKKRSVLKYLSLDYKSCFLLWYFRWISQ
jgi:hypothetical protein